MDPDTPERHPSPTAAENGGWSDYPRRLMGHAARTGRYGPPLAVAALLTAGCAAALVAWVMVPAQLLLLDRLSAETPATAWATARAWLTGGRLVPGLAAARGLAAVVGVYVAAAVTHGLAILVARDREFRFPQTLAVVAYANLALVLGEVVKTAAILAGGSAAAWGPAWLLPPGVARLACLHLDVFHLTGLALAALGISVICNFRLGKAAALVGGLWTVTVLLQVTVRVLV